jgi:hypothetical protein
VVGVEYVAAIATILSSIVVIVGAFAAVRQLRHLRASNEVAVLQNVLNRYESSDVMESHRFITGELAERMDDPAFIAALSGSGLSGDARKLNPALDFWESVGAFVRAGAISQESIMYGFSYLAVSYWRLAAPAIDVLRRAQDPSVCEHFEHVAALSTRWLEAPRSERQKGLLRMPADAAEIRPARTAPPASPESRG